MQDVESLEKGRPHRVPAPLLAQLFRAGSLFSSSTVLWTVHSGQAKHTRTAVVQNVQCELWAFRMRGRGI